MRIRRLRPAIALLPLLFCIAGSVTRAQQSAGSSPPTVPQPVARPAHAGHPPRLADQLDRLTVKLHLTADQQARVKSILDRRRAEMVQLRKAEPLGTADRFAKVEAVKRGALDDIDALLTDEQRKIFRPNR